MKWGGERSGGAEGRWDYGGAIAPHFICPTLRPTHSPPGGLWGGDYRPPPPLCSEKNSTGGYHPPLRCTPDRE